MKLAEALILRSDFQKRLAQIKMRLSNNILIQEGEEPSEDPKALLDEFTSVLNEITSLIKRINKTNGLTPFNEDLTLSEALAERDALLEKRSLLASAAEQASGKQDRYSRTEIKYVSTINVKAFQKEIDRISQEYRNIDTKIQGLNWNIDLI